MKPKNQPVGTVECDRKECSETCNVFKFRPRAEGRRTVFTDKYYFECPKHGRIGADGNSTVTEYILCNAKMSGPVSTGDSQKNRAPATTPAQGSRPTISAELGRSDPPKSTAGTPVRTPWRTLIDLE